MRMLVASDLHGSMQALKFLIQKTRELKPELLLLLGDLVYHGPRNPLPASYNTAELLSTLAELNALPCSLLAVKGNCDAEVDLELMPFRVVPEAWLSMDGFDFFASHGHRIPEYPPIPGIKPGMAVLRGHTHIPRAEESDGIQFWNPGSLSLPKGGFPPSWGFYDNGRFQVLDMDNRELMAISLAS